MAARAWVGISGYDYESWRGRFYPSDLARKRWLAHAAGVLSSIELNGTFYSLKSPSSYASWAAQVPDGYVLAVKGGRFITHMKKLKDVDGAVANFYASGVLALAEKTGPFLWQLPDVLAFDPARMERFFALLPRDSRAAAALAHQHDQRVRAPLVDDPASSSVPYRHALEPRHPSFFTREARALLRKHDIAFVSADAAGKFPMSTEPSASFAYVRLHGSPQLYASRYSDAALDEWAVRIRAWLRRGLDTYVYFDNDAHGHAPFDALRLEERLARSRRVPQTHRATRSRSTASRARARRS